MAVRKTDHQYRKDLVLGIVVNAYIRTVNPVSSALISQEYLADLSSATIRNILAELEQDGFLTHPHTSAGRVPTQDGYRYYVDYLMREIQLLEEEKLRINKEYQQGIRNLERVLERTSEVISDLTHYTSIVSVDHLPHRFICRGTSYIVEYPCQNDISIIRGILQELERKERILDLVNRDLEQKIKIFIGHELACANFEDCSLAVTSFRAGRSRGRIAILGPTRMDYQRVISALEYVSLAMEEISV